MVKYNCVHCGKAIEVADVYAGTSGACPFCGTHSPGASPAKMSGLAIASLVCGLLGFLLLPAIPAIVFGILGIRQVNRSQGAVKGRGLAIAGMIVGGILLLLGLSLVVATNYGMKMSNRRICEAHLHDIAIALRIYAYQNKGHWPTVYSYPAVATERWGPGFDPTTGNIADRGTSGTTFGEHGPFTCNVSAWWILIRNNMATSGIFICPCTTMDPDTTPDPTQYWSFSKIGNVSYSYQNQLGRNSTDKEDPRMIVAADRNPCRGDCTEVQKGIDPKKRWLMNSPNHDFEGQNCLFADGHVEFLNTPDCGVKHNNIWLRSTGVDSADSEVVEDTSSYSDDTSQVGDKFDSFLVP